MSRQPCQRLAKRRQAQNLRADMRADSAPLDPPRIPILQVQRKRGSPINAEFMAALPRGNVRMSSRLNIRIYANRRRCPHSGPRSLARQNLQLRPRLHIKQPDPRPQRLSNLLARLAGPRKNNRLRLRPGALEPEKFAHRNNIEPAAQPGQHSQNRKIRIRLHRIANRVRLPPQRLVELAIRARDARRAINVRRGPRARGNLLQTNALAAQILAAPGKFRCVAYRIDYRGCRGVQAPRTRPAGGRGTHRTFITTSVRSSVIAMPRVNS